MAKVSLGDLSNVLGNPTSAANTVNNNNTLIEAAFENTVSRNGASPNQMLADFDMNNNDILNAGEIHADAVYLDGAMITPSDFVDSVALKAAIESIPTTINLKAPPRIIVPTMDYYGVVNIDTAGADTTGTSLSSAAIQKAFDVIDTYWSNGGGQERGTRLQLYGRLRVNSNLQLPRKQNLIIDGGGGTIRQEIATNMLFFPVASGASNRYFRMRDLSFEAGIANPTGLTVQSVVGGGLDNVSFNTDGTFKWGNACTIDNCQDFVINGGLSKNLLTAMTGLSDVAGTLYTFSGIVLNVDVNFSHAQSWGCPLFGQTAGNPGIEGIKVVSPSWVNMYNGPILRNTGYSASGAFSWHGGHLQFIARGAEVVGATNAEVRGVNLQKDTLWAQPGEYIAFGTCDRSMISDNTCELIGAGSMQGSMGIFVSGGNWNRIKDNSVIVSSTSLYAILSTGVKDIAYDNQSTRIGNAFSTNSGSPDPTSTDGVSMQGSGGVKRDNRALV